METHDHSRIAVVKLFLVVGFDKERQRGTIRTERRLDNVGNIALVRFGIEIFEVLTALLDVAA